MLYSYLQPHGGSTESTQPPQDGKTLPLPKFAIRKYWSWSFWFCTCVHTLCVLLSITFEMAAINTLHQCILLTWPCTTLDHPKAEAHWILCHAYVGSCCQHTYPDNIQFLIPLHELLFQFHDLGHGFVLRVLQLFRQLRNCDKETVSGHTSLWPGPWSEYMSQTNRGPLESCTYSTGYFLETLISMVLKTFVSIKINNAYVASRKPIQQPLRVWTCTAMSPSVSWG